MNIRTVRLLQAPKPERKNAANDRPGQALSPRLVQTADLLAAGKTNAEIGMILGTTTPCAKQYVEKVRKRLGACNRTLAAVRWAEKKLKEQI